MTLDIVIIRPEFFIVFSFCIQLRYGTGGLITPYAEIIILTVQNTVSSDTSSDQKNSMPEKSAFTFLMVEMRNQKRIHTFPNIPSAGPNHAASVQCFWAVQWCLTMTSLFLYSPLESVFIGGCFQKDAYSLQQCSVQFQTAAFVLTVSQEWQKTAGIVHVEYIYQAMLALIGQYQQILTTDLMAIYLCQEQQSFSLVVQCALNYKSAYSIEAAIKYFQQSAFRSCLLQQGIGFIYWQTGETTISHIEKIMLSTATEPSLFLLQGIWLVTIGLLWKLAAAPLHFWVPDVYMGAWSSVSQWITVLPKIAVLGFWTHHWHHLYSNTFGGNILAIFRNLSMIIGALAPQAQTSLKRQQAYSSINHMGLQQMPLCRPGIEAMSALWTHMFIYILMNLGVWSMLMVQYTRPSHNSINQKHSAVGPQYIMDQKGLNQSSATMAFAWAVQMVGLRGLPPVYGFLGKATIIRSSQKSAQYRTVAIALITTLIASVYYQKVQKVCYVDNPKSWGTPETINSTNAYIVAIIVALLQMGQWHGNYLFQQTHQIVQNVSINSGI